MQTHLRHLYRIPMRHRQRLVAAVLRHLLRHHHRATILVNRHPQITWRLSHKERGTNVSHLITTRHHSILHWNRYRLRTLTLIRLTHQLILLIWRHRYSTHNVGLDNGNGLLYRLYLLTTRALSAYIHHLGLDFRLHILHRWNLIRAIREISLRRVATCRHATYHRLLLRPDGLNDVNLLRLLRLLR